MEDLDRAIGLDPELLVKGSVLDPEEKGWSDTFHLHRIESISIKKDVAGTPEASPARMPTAEAKRDDGKPKGINKDRIIQ